MRSRVFLRLLNLRRENKELHKKVLNLRVWNANQEETILRLLQEKAILLAELRGRVAP